jgi:hypothetical protein
VDSFITALHGLAEYCEYGALKEELIRDRIVVGMSDTKTSETIQLRAAAGRGGDDGKKSGKPAEAKSGVKTGEQNDCCCV